MINKDKNKINKFKIIVDFKLKTILFRAID